MHRNHIVQELLCVSAQFFFTLTAAMDHYGDLAQMAQHFSVSRLGEHSDLLKLLPSVNTADVLLHATKVHVHTLSVGDRRIVTTCILLIWYRMISTHLPCAGTR